MPFTRSRSSLCRKRTKEEAEASGLCSDSSHDKMIASLKREILELKKSLDVEREQRTETIRVSTVLSARGTKWERDQSEQGHADTVHNAATKTAIPCVGDAHVNVRYELELCKKELDDTREALREACEDREALRIKLSESQTRKVAGSH